MEAARRCCEVDLAQKHVTMTTSLLAFSMAGQMDSRISAPVPMLKECIIASLAAATPVSLTDLRKS